MRRQRSSRSRRTSRSRQSSVALVTLLLVLFAGLYLWTFAHGRAVARRYQASEPGPAGIVAVPPADH